MLPERYTGDCSSNDQLRKRRQAARVPLWCGVKYGARFVTRTDVSRGGGWGDLDETSGAGFSLQG